MSFNQNMFNRTPFNLSAGGNVHWLNLDGSELVDSFSGVSQQIYLFCVPGERVLNQSHLTRFVQLRDVNYNPVVAGHEDLGWMLSIEGSFWVDCQMREILTSQINPSHTLHVKSNGSETLNSEKNRVHWHRNVWPEGMEVITSEATRQLLYCPPKPEGLELISELVTMAITVEEIVCILNLSLEPGEKLIVDANNYNVLVNNQNMIHTQEGRWLDEIDRNTIDITITAASGSNSIEGISAKILYTERWL